ncbi:phage tail protein [Mannheimia haemolytica USDA-ARS-USMARC-185]|uniref:TipJ family phage tail tip protein n=1 Tax=Mannheimia haemolytica TaxID=75985 RepID=UPI0002C4DEAE|nr:phage tail protein [Mannheimia haemolytica]AGI35732.1 phage tail protein [Mannheimia haemolytica USDA-ARS-USMARC-185]
MGGKKQGSARTPHEAPDSLKSAQRLRAIGLISLGPIKGPVNKWKSTYFDNTPIQNENGIDDNDEASFNFKNTEVSFTLGTQDQAPLQGFEMSEREVSVSTEVKYTTPITRTVTDPDVTRLRVTLGVNALYEQNDQGDTNGTSVWFRILINGLPRATYEINGKSSSRFYRSYIIDNLPERPFTITVERTTTDSKSQRLQNATNWVSYTEIIDTKLSYPNMALVGIKTDSRYNPNFPNVNFLLYGRLVKVPSTYDPETRTYSTALWKGDWKQAWTNNPAWVFYDLVTDPLAGLGKRVGDYGLDKFQLYQIAKYCDELVDDGYGGKEPRMTANLWLTDQRSAYDVLSDMASVFRSIAVWNGTQFTAIQDRTTDPVCTYSQANVIDGKFSRQYAAMKSIYTAVEVEYADERNMYQKAVEYVADDLMIDRYGYNVKKMTAYATTSRGQAHRWGKWVLATSLLEQCTITFSVGRQGLLHLPGDIIEVADNDYAGKTLGGRVVAVNGKVVTLDQPIEISGNSYLSYLNDEMKVVKVAISSVNSKNKAVVTLSSVPTGLEPMDDWVLKTPTVSTQLYRAIGITENDDGSYTITALQHEPQKESIVDGSASFIPVVTTAHTGGAQKVANAEASINENGVKLTWEMPSSNSIVKYEVRLYRNGVLYQTYLDLETTELTFDDLPDGSYVAEIRSKNANGQLSDPVTRAFEINLTINRLTTKSLYFSIQLDWDLPKTATVGNYTEIWRSVDNNIRNAKKIATLPYPQNSHILNGIDLNESYYFFVRCGDKAGNKGQFTEGVFGEADHNPDTLLNVLEGQITRSQLGADLIASLQQDIDTAVAGEARLRQSAVANAVSQIMAESQARAKAIQDEVKARTVALTTEANNRTKAIQAESANLTKKIQAETTARGTAVTQLQNVDAQQAQLISAVTTKADNALSGLEEEKTARANADKAESQAREALTARMGTAEVNIATIQRTVATNAQSISEVSQNLNAKIDNINIGGRNLLRDSEFNLYNKWGNPQIDFTENANRRTIKLIATGTSGPVGICSVNRHCTSYFQQGETYTLSFFARGNRPLDYLYLMRQDGGNAILPVIDIASETEFNYYKLTFKAPFTTQQGYLLVGFRQTSAEQFVEFHSVKLEKGNVATDWTPAPEDVDSAVSAVSADLTSYKQTQAATDSAQAQQLNQLSVNLTKAESNLNAKITEEKKARVDADKVNADKLTDITSRVANAESSITGIQSTKASKTEVASLAQNSLQAIWKADAKSAVDALSIGARNLLIDSTYIQYLNYNPNMATITSGTYKGSRLLRLGMLGGTGVAGVVQAQATQVSNIRQGQEYTLSLNVQGTAGIQKTGLNYVFLMRADGANQRLATIPVIASLLNRPKITFTAEWTSERAYLLVGVNGTYETTDWLAFHSVKLEKGNVATDWTPAPEDVDSAVSAVSAKIDTIQQTLANSDSALSSRIDSLTASVNSNKAQISQVSNAVAGVNGKLSATHTIKAQTIAGGRTAIAGIAMGASSDGVTTESSVIVMADKFGVVANANDGNVKPVFSIANGQVGIRGDLIADGSIIGDKIRANTDLSSPNINGGNISGTNITGTTISGGTITGTTVSGGTVTGAIVSGGTVKGSRIEGGVISGSTILGDIVKAVILTKKGNNFEGTVPASEISSRTVVIPSISFNANSGETSTVTIYIDGIKVAESSVSGIRKEIPIMATIASTEIRGSVSVSVSGDVGGDLSGQVSGSVSGQASGMVSGQASGTVSGNVNGFVNGGYVSGQVSGMASGHLSGTASGSLSGQVSGEARGRATGRVTGTATGFATGTTPMTNIRTSFMLEVPTSGSISGYKQITGKSVIIKVTANNATALGGQNSLVALVA